MSGSAISASGIEGGGAFTSLPALSKGDPNIDCACADNTGISADSHLDDDADNNGGDTCGDSSGDTCGGTSGDGDDDADDDNRDDGRE